MNRSFHFGGHIEVAVREISKGDERVCSDIFRQTLLACISCGVKFPELRLTFICSSFQERRRCLGLLHHPNGEAAVQSVLSVLGWRPTERTFREAELSVFCGILEECLRLMCRRWSTRFPRQHTFRQEPRDELIEAFEQASLAPRIL